MEQIVLIVHVLAALAIIGLIMIQQGKGADMGASFGAGASQTLFGSGGSGNVLTKSTTMLVTVFFATSFGLAVLAKQNAIASGNVDIPQPMLVEKLDAKPVEDNSEIPGAMQSVADDVSGSDDMPSDIPSAGAADSNLPASSDMDIPE